VVKDLIRACQSTGILHKAWKKKKFVKGTVSKQILVETFHNPSLASMTNSILEFIGTCLISGSELKWALRLWSPNALATASWPFTRGTSPARKPQIE